MTVSTKDEIQAYYRDPGTASRYVAIRFSDELNRLLHDRQVAAVQRCIDTTAPARILEVAPGPGRVTRDVRPGGALVCLEYNAAMIGQGAPATSGKAAWVRGDGFKLPFGPVFDLLYTFRFVRHFRRADRERLYAEFRRVLKPGGWLIFDAVNEKVSRPLREAHPEDYPVYDKLYVEKELRTELSAAGFAPVAMEPVLKSYRWQYRSQVLVGPRANWLNRCLVRSLECLPRRAGLEWVVTCRRA